LPIQTQPDRLEIVLVSPRNPLNIGAAARAMANFGFTQLTVVAPYEPHWREAQSAVGAEALLQNAKVCSTLAEAVAGCTLVIGTGTLTYRKAEQPLVLLPDLPQRIEQSLSANGRAALIFGPEKHGLTREDLSYCHLLAEIPTDPAQPSMNLGQAVAVCLYEISTRAFSPAASPSLAPSEPGSVTKSGSAAPSGDLDLLSGVIDQVMLAAHYSPASMRQANQHELRLFLRRLTLSARDTRRVLGFFRRVLHRLEGKREKS
jgi:tRNA/rRNA methyltransferase